MAGPLENLRPFQPGQSGNPGGKATGTRNRVTTKFLQVLADDFEANGKEAVVAAREQNPLGYIKTVAELLPKQVENAAPMDDMTDEQLFASIAYLRSRLTAEAGTGADQTVQ